MEHFSVNAEQSVIFALALYSNQAQQVFNTITDEDFFDNTCKRRFKKFRSSFQSGQYKEFSAQHLSKVDTPAEIMKLWEAVNIVRNHAIRRKIEKSITDLSEACRDYSNDVNEIQTTIRDIMFEAIDTRACRTASLTSDDIEKTVDGLTGASTAFYTGLESVDRYSPIQPGDFVLIGARPGAGKSALLSGMILENFLGKDNKNGLFFCIEMDARQNYSRLSSQMSNVPLSKYIDPYNNPPTKGEFSSITDSLSTIKSKFPDRWFVEGSVTIEEICQMTEIYKPHFIVVDYVQIVKSKGDMYERLSMVSTTLRQLALKHNIAVIAVAQLNRDANGAMPSMSQIKGSGQFEQDATHIYLLDRPESERTNSVGKRNYVDKRNNEISIFNPQSPTNRAALICSKNRNGPTFYSILDFDPKTTSFTEYID